MLLEVQLELEISFLSNTKLLELADVIKSLITVFFYIYSIYIQSSVNITYKKFKIVLLVN